MEQHGNVNVFWDGDILTLKTQGAFNKKGVDQGNALLKSMVLNREYEQWYRLQILDEQTLASPENIDYAMSKWNWSFEHGCVFFALVVANCVQAYGFRKLPHRNIKIFTDLAEAKEGIKQRRI